MRIALAKPDGKRLTKEFEGERQRLISNPIPIVEASMALASIEFFSWIPATMKPSIERLFFFNPQQAVLKSRIRDTVVATGIPYLVEDSGRVQLAVESGRLQCLFACSSESELLGIALYDRPEAARLRICHLVVEPQFSQGGKEKEGLAFAIIERVRLIGRSISGVELIQLPYRSNSCLRISKPLERRT